MESILEVFNNDIVALGILLLGGFWGGKLVNRFKFPAVTGYLLAGILVGHFGLIHADHIEQYQFVEVLGLSIVALIIGGSINFRRLKQIARSVLVITIVQVVGAFSFVLVGTKIFLPVSFEICLLLGAVAAATAPASPVTVIRELRAKGPLTETLMAVVGLDDAACLILFGLTAAFVNIMAKGEFALLMVLLPVWELLGSVAIGIMVGFLIIKLLHFCPDRHETVIVLIGTAFLLGEVAEHAGLSALLVNMAAGIIIGNFYARTNVFHILEDVELPVFVVFFTLAGASLRLDILFANWNIAVVYIVTRAIGKVGGAFLGARVSGADEVVKKYLGFAMLSQAGVAIALVLNIQTRFPQYGSLINAIILAAVTFNELLGPVGTKYALTLAKERGKA